MSKTFFVLVLSVGTILTLVGYSEYSEQKQKNKRNAEILHKVDSYNKFVKSFNDNIIFSCSEDCLDEDKKIKVRVYTELKNIIYAFNKAESLLEQAKNLHKNLSEEGKVNPLAIKLFYQTEDVYKDCKDRIDALSELKNDKEFNFMFNYARGNIYYRITECFATPQTVNDLFEQTLISYKNALKFKAGDIDTCVNIEIMVKNEEFLNKGATRNGSEKTRQLLQKPSNAHFKGN